MSSLKFFRIALLAQALLLPILLSAINLDIRIFSDINFKSATFTPISGKYGLYEEGEKKLELYKGSSLVFKVAAGNKIAVYRDNELLGNFNKPSVRGEGFVNAFNIKPDIQGVAPRVYDDNLKFSVVNRNLRIINNVDIERYVAGVVQSEGGGSSKEIEFFYVQAIICRTYALNNHRKHAHEGFHLCDDVHCQVYKGRCRIADIMMAVTHTMGEVVVDPQKRMISAAFHSNCGGETCNSEDVWTIATPYLKSIDDTFCLSMRNARWTERIPISRFMAYLQRHHGFSAADSSRVLALLPFTQPKRKIFFTENVALKDIRSGLGLRSTFFSIRREGNDLVFEGRGFGHGVGLCQEGAIRMAETAYPYHEIIKYYYTDVEIVNYLELRSLLKEFQSSTESQK